MKTSTNLIMIVVIGVLAGHILMMSSVTTAGPTPTIMASNVLLYQGTEQFCWHTKRALVTTDDTFPNVTTDPNCLKWATKATHCFWTPKSWNRMMMRVRFSAGNGTTADIVIYQYRENDDGQLVYSGSLTAGLQNATMGGTYADTATGSVTSRFLKTVSEVDAAGNNGMFNILFDGCGGGYYAVYFDNISTGTVSLDMTSF